MAPDCFREQRDQVEGKLQVPYVYCGVLLNAAISAPGCQIQIIAEINRNIHACVKGRMLL